MNPLGLFLEPPGPLLTHLHTVLMACSECLPTRLNPLAERTCFSQVPPVLRGEAFLSLCISEPGAGSDVANLSTTAVAEPDGKHWVR